MLVIDLPDDILYGIFPHLTAWEFLNFTGSSRALYIHRDFNSFWHALTRKTFRIPPQPLLQQAKWQSLYKKLLTQTRLYTWGNNENRNLGRTTTFEIPSGEPHHVWSSGWPRRPDLRDLDIGIVADVQCGGWCTTLLNSTGNVFIFGAFDGSDRRVTTHMDPRQLAFPPAYPPCSKTRYEPSTAIQQLSTGRSLVLGLSDDGKVWSWTSNVAARIMPLHVDIKDHKVEKVVAGWERGSMYVQDVGIIYWASERESDLLDGGRQENLAIVDAVLIDTVTIPGTAFRRAASSRFSPDSLDARIGEVTYYIVLESHIVFTTHLNKIFSYPNVYPMPAIDFTEPVELTTFLDAREMSHFRILDLQGSFRKFAVFMDNGEIWTANHEFLDAFHNMQISTEETNRPLPLPTLFPQEHGQSRTISIAFGDHHSHALHEDGTLTSWGQQSRACGALGLGNLGREVIRGLHASRWGRDQFLPLAQAKTVWFEPLMEEWLGDVYAHTKGMEVPEQINGRPSMEVFGDYYEKKGAEWEDNIAKEEGDLGAYFVLKVAAAGWSSAALVLVDEERAESARQSHIVKPSAAPSETESDAEYEYGDSPFDMVEIALKSISDWLWRSGRYFLGLNERDARAQANTLHGRESEEIYTWYDNVVPLEEIIAGNGDSE